eukprot:4843043-Amphidinium_carterae.1
MPQRHPLPGTSKWFLWTPAMTGRPAPCLLKIPQVLSLLPSIHKTFPQCKLSQSLHNLRDMTPSLHIKCMTPMYAIRPCHGNPLQCDSEKREVEAVVDSAMYVCLAVSRHVIWDTPMVVLGGISDSCHEPVETTWLILHRRMVNDIVLAMPTACVGLQLQVAAVLTQAPQLGRG